MGQSRTSSPLFLNFYFLNSIHPVNCTEWTFVHLIADLRSEIPVGFLVESLR